MNNINLCEILKGHQGETFYSPVFGKLTLTGIRFPEVIFMSGTNETFHINCTGKFYDSADELVVYPSKDQRDWEKWDKENNHKIPKTWSDIEDNINDTTIAVDNLSAALPITTNHKNIKSALALLKIHQLIEVGYGGNVTKEEWYDICPKWIITECAEAEFVPVCARTQQHKSHIAFHTVGQALEFLSYLDNVQLLKDYFMI